MVAWLFGWRLHCLASGFPLYCISLSHSFSSPLVAFALAHISDGWRAAPPLHTRFCMESHSGGETTKGGGVYADFGGCASVCVCACVDDSAWLSLEPERAFAGLPFVLDFFPTLFSFSGYSVSFFIFFIFFLFLFLPPCPRRRIRVVPSFLSCVGALASSEDRGGKRRDPPAYERQRRSVGRSHSECQCNADVTERDPGERRKERARLHSQKYEMHPMPEGNGTAMRLPVLANAMRAI
ncbi:hypothetical protein J3F83DRAFT_400768 [Trichoderma novae-zelandiae]